MNDQSPPLIVGIGASAGGLQALKTFFQALPSESGLAFAVIMHLAPDRESELDRLLQHDTTMPVTQVTEAVAVEPDHVYVIPPGKQLSVEDGHFNVTDFEAPHGHRAPIDHFFRTLAEAPSSGAGIILSGSGTDGTVGVKAIKSRGGLVMAQSPEEAAYDGMPHSAITAGVVDVVETVAELARTLVDALESRTRIQLPDRHEKLSDDDGETLRKILTRLQAETGHAFGQYKRSTVLRRIQRRMQVCQAESLSTYLRLLRRDRNEVRSLFDDLLISVTNFFRDDEAFATLNEQVIPALFEGKRPEDSVRVWICGCATGEEAYSVAMLLLEHAEHIEHPPDVQVFATDLNDKALDYARQGRYPKAVAADISEERLARYFISEEEHYCVRSALRDCILFASHNLLEDPPFSHIDLVTCRNLLIYFNSGLQKKVFRLFHYALQPGGCLFLGSAESTGDTELFEAISKPHNLYRRRDRSEELAGLPSMPLVTGTPDTSAGSAGTPSGTHSSSTVLPAAEQHRRLLEAYTPPSVIVDANYNLVHASERAGRYLQHPGGEPTHKLTRLVRPELRLELQTALHRAFHRGTPTETPSVRLRLDGHDEQVRLLVQPASQNDDARHSRSPHCDETPDRTPPNRALVIFETVDAETNEGEEESASSASAASSSHQKLQEELQRTKEELQTVITERQASEQKMQAANEELRSMNEEYKSTTEELETSKEELQSTNEELQTVNQQLEHKVAALKQSNSDLKNLMMATEGATLFLTRDLRIRRFTPRIEKLFNIQKNDRGRPLADLTHQFDYDGLSADAEAVLEDLRLTEHEVQTTDGRWLLVRLRPYRTVEDKIDGVVVTFVDVTTLKETEAELRTAKTYAEKIVDTIHESLVVLDSDLRVQSANEAFYHTFEVTPEVTEGRLLFELGNNQWDIPALRQLLEGVLPDNNAFSGFEVTHNFEEIGRRVMLLNARRIDAKQLILLAIEDVTERQEAMRRLQAMNETLEERAAQVRTLASRLAMAEQAERRRISQVLHDDLQQRLYGIQMKMTFIRKAAQSTEHDALLAHAEEAFAWIEDAFETTRNLTVDLSPPVLKNEGLADALLWLRSQMREMHGLEVAIEADEKHLPALDEDMRVLLFQTVRELLFNVVKHAEVNRARVALNAKDDHLVIHVCDEGRGFDPDAIELSGQGEESFGLYSVRERLRLFGGEMTIDAAPGEGTRIKIRIPIRPSDETRAAAGVLLHQPPSDGIPEQPAQGAEDERNEQDRRA